MIRSPNIGARARGPMPIAKVFAVAREMMLNFQKGLQFCFDKV
jgi:hypothetical protein